MKSRISNHFSIIIILISLSCSTIDREDVHFKNNFKEKVLSVIENKQDSTINIGEISLSEWDTMYVFRPYTTIDSLRTVLGIEWKDAGSILEKQNGSNSLIVFVKDENVIDYSIVPKNYGDFMRLKSQGPFRRSEAIFKVKKEKYGEQDWIFIYELDR